MSNVDELSQTLSTMEAENKSSFLPIKIHYQGQIRRFTIRKTETWSALVTKICDIFKLHKTDLVLKYEDQEKDLVDVDSNVELQYALRLAESRGVIVIHLSTRPSNNTVEIPSEVICSSVATTEVQSKDQILEEKLIRLEELGFTDRELNLTLLQQFSSSSDALSQVIELLLASQQNQETEKSSFSQMPSSNSTLTVNEAPLEVLLVKKPKEVEIDEALLQLEKIGFLDYNLNTVAVKRYYKKGFDKVIRYILRKQSKQCKKRERKVRHLEKKCVKYEYKRIKHEMKGTNVKGQLKKFVDRTNTSHFAQVIAQ